jgi:O-antigen/teichoic acid export membrane protein
MNRDEIIPSQSLTTRVAYHLKRARGWFKDRLFRQLFKNVGVLVSGDALSSLFGLGCLALTTRALGARQFGVLVLVQTYAALVDRLVSFQSWQGLIKYGAEALEQKRCDEFKGLIKLGTALDTAGAVLGAAIGISVAYGCGHWLGWDQETLRMAMAYSSVILCSLSGTPTGVVRLFDQFRLFAAQRVLVESFKLIAVFAAYLSGASLWVFVLIWMAGDGIKHLFLLFMAHRLLYRRQVRGWWKWRVPDWRAFLTFSCWSNLTSTLDIPVKQLDVFIVSSVVSFEAVGVYKIIKQVSQVLSKVADPVYQAIYPQFALLVANAQELRAAKMVVKLGLLLLVVSVPLVILMSVTSPWWLNKFFGQVFAAESLVLSAYLALQTCALACEGIHPLFVAMGYVQKNFLILALANGCFLVAACLLGRQAGLMGIVWALGIQFSMVIAMKTGYIVHKLRTTS